MGVSSTETPDIGSWLWKTQVSSIWFRDFTRIAEFFSHSELRLCAADTIEVSGRAVAARTVMYNLHSLHPSSH